MIKLTIDSKTQSSYVKSVLPDVLKRICYLKISIDNVLSGVSVLDKGLVSYGPITRDLIGIIENNDKYKDKDFTAVGYVKTIDDYRTGPNSLSSADLKKVRILLDHLKHANGKWIEKLLICDPRELSRVNAMLEKFYITNPLEQKVIKLAFNYDRFDDIANGIRKFFNDNDIAKHCPYCNKEETTYIVSDGRKISGHQLDHFFSQKDFPLLSYSLFNLVPSGEKCNGSILKGYKQFSDEFHLNPYLGSFEDDAYYVPVVINKTVDEIFLELNPGCDGKKRAQLIGSGVKIDEKSEEGNINVFGLQGRYGINKDDAERILRFLHDNNSNLRSILKYVELMFSRIVREEIHREWYSKYIGTPFEPENFSKKMLSKFNRDIHDSYYRDDSKIYNEFIREMIRYNKD